MKYHFKEISSLDFGEDVKFGPTRLSTKFLREKSSNVSFGGSRMVTRFGNSKVQLALVSTHLLVFADLLDDPYQILMVTLAAALRGIGYEFEVPASFIYV
ncbi:hypothetical protein Hdeb2414_s0014g00431971 [Helianthus debilis subsp. tardiflorus]